MIYPFLWAVSTLSFLHFTTSASVSTSSPAYQDAQAYLKGVNIDYAVKECSQAQFDTLVEAFYLATDLGLAPGDFSPADESFIEFFGYGYSNEYDRFYRRVYDNLKKAAHFPRQYPPGELGLKGRVDVRCTDFRGHCPGKKVAYTGYDRGTGTPYIVFCPIFFDGTVPLKHLSELERGTPTTDLWSLFSYSAVVLHELMHVNVMDFEPPVNDVCAQLDGELEDCLDKPGQSIAYAPNRCRKLAEKQGSNHRVPYVQTTRNGTSPPPLPTLYPLPISVYLFVSC